MFRIHFLGQIPRRRITGSKDIHVSSSQCKVPICFSTRPVSIFTTQQRVTVPTHHTQSKAAGQDAKSGAAGGYFHQPSLAPPLVTAFEAVRSHASPSPLSGFSLSSNPFRHASGCAISELPAQNKAHPNTPAP